ncbi:MAG: threonylcarbamoyl-AMP synthase [Proteobacteria bacterium]|nr:threonylcarbamoyl-AMP synthase [Pseudomonadota bacterium]
MHPSEIARAARLLETGELIGLPTETVYGLAADADSAAAVRRIFAVKGRPADHPVIVHLHRNADPQRWAVGLPDAARRLIDAFWPGPLTLVLRRRSGMAEACAGGQDTIALRCPAHPMAQAVLAIFRHGEGGLAAPSANRFGRVSPTMAAHVRAELGGAVAMVLDGGACAVGIESTIVDCSQVQSGGAPRILRPGGLPAEAIATVLGCDPLLLGLQKSTQLEAPSRGAFAVESAIDGRAQKFDSSPRVPGALAAHYAPATPLFLRSAPEIDAGWSTARDVGVIAVHPQPGVNALGTWFALPSDAAGFAHALYAALRDLDMWGLGAIWVELPPSDPAWDAVRDRLQRASHGSRGQGA